MDTCNQNHKKQLEHEYLTQSTKSKAEMDRLREEHSLQHSQISAKCSHLESTTSSLSSSVEQLKAENQRLLKRIELISDSAIKDKNELQKQMLEVDRLNKYIFAYKAEVVASKQKIKKDGETSLARL